MNTIVLDNGGSGTRIGFAGDEEPKQVFPSMIGRPKHVRVMAGSIASDLQLGSDALKTRGLCKLTHPVQRGIVTNWQDMELLWQHSYEQMQTQSELHPLLITEAPQNPRRNRESLAQVLFEQFNVPALYVAIPGILSLYASGRTTGVVVDSGDGLTSVVPVYEGFAVPQAISRIDVGGRDVTEYLARLLRHGQNAVNFWSSAEMDLCRSVKEKVAYLSATGQDLDLGEVEEYILPDGQTIALSSERYMAPELLFKPELNGSECPGLHDLLVDSINKVDLDLRKALYGNITLAGGGTLTKGFGGRLLSEVKKCAMRDVKIKIYAPPERRYSAWIGGSILASLSTFKKLWVTAEEYDEDPDIVHRKML